MSIKEAISEHWPEYMIEASLLGCFMISVGVLVTAFESPGSLLYVRIQSSGVRTLLLALAVGVCLSLLIHSPWGKRSGAHMNPAITLAFLRLKKIHPYDAIFYVLAQTLGGTLGIVVVAVFAGKLFTDPPVHYALTLPGQQGELVAFIAEVVISFFLMAAILVFTGSSRLIRFTGLAIGCLVAFFIVVEAPLSGTSMNPARTLASAVPVRMWEHLWIYLLAPTIGMLTAAEMLLFAQGRNEVRCAKLLHPSDVKCIHCGYQPNSNPL